MEGKSFDHKLDEMRLILTEIQLSIASGSKDTEHLRHRVDLIDRELITLRASAATVVLIDFKMSVLTRICWLLAAGVFGILVERIFPALIKLAA